MRLPVSSRKTSSSVGVRNVRSRIGTPHWFSATATALIVAAPSAVETSISSPWASTPRTPATGSRPRRARLGVAVDACDDDVGADAALQVVGRALGDDAAAVDDADAVRELVGLFEVLRREEDRHPELVG